MNLVKINSLSLKHERFSPTGCKDTGNRTFEFVAKTQFPCMNLIGLIQH